MRNYFLFLGKLLLLTLGIHSVLFFSSSVSDRYLFPVEPVPLHDKVHFFNQHEDTYDGVIIGSSHSHRGVIPSVLKEQTGKRFFNLSYGGLTPPRSVEIAKYLLSETSQIDNKVLILEVGPWVLLPAHKHQPLNYNVPTTDGFRCLFAPNSPFTTRDALKFLFSRILKFRDLPYYRFQSFKPPASYSYPWVATDGFRSLDDDFEESTEKHDPAQTRMRRKHFLENHPDPRGVVELNTPTDPKLRYTKFEEVYTLCVKKNTSLIFLIHPRLNNEQARFISTFYSLPHSEKVPIINFSDPSRYPEFWEAENVFDRDHLNARGARLLSVHLSSKIDEVNATQ